MVNEKQIQFDELVFLSSSLDDDNMNDDQSDNDDDDDKGTPILIEYIYI